MMNASTLDMIQRGGFLLLLFVVVATVVFLAFGWIEQRRVTRERLGTGATPRAGTGAGDEAAVATLKTVDKQSVWIGLIQAVERRGIPLIDPKDKSLRARLVSAGFESPAAPSIYSFSRLALVILLPVLALVLMWLSGQAPSVFKIYMIGAGAALLGLYVPSIYIGLRARRYQQEIVNGFPDALDLMLVCVEAGLGLEAAFNRVGMEMTRSHPLLARQFGTVVYELRAGRSHENALRRMADRAGSEDIRGFATLLVQSARLGSSIAQTLRTYSAEMRERRRMRAEEKAHRLPVLLSIPLVGFMLPTMIGVLMLPAFIRVVRTLLPALAGDAP
ncbi:type II secretion system F family protein [Sphingomonas sp. HDW15A]|uniref:type II secretion system F family protein n=1 Tax=Sphingomonas sp. HDW15A TaxID=2714942 RepID=UPI00140A816F|nr:type II secretion system F family protein [Sphingomonas sp. HDW15A]QIK95678.1 type II secretion system F family protein [Sphingomonas sp. HDW15A]